MNKVLFLFKKKIIIIIIIIILFVIIIIIKTPMPLKETKLFVAQALVDP